MILRKWRRIAGIFEIPETNKYVKFCGNFRRLLCLLTKICLFYKNFRSQFLMIFVSLQILICLFIVFIVPFDKILGDDDKFLEFWEVTSNSWNFRKKNYAFKVRFWNSALFPNKGLFIYIFQCLFTKNFRKFCSEFSFVAKHWFVYLHFSSFRYFVSIKFLETISNSWNFRNSWNCNLPENPRRSAKIIEVHEVSDIIIVRFFFTRHRRGRGNGEGFFFF